MGFSSLVFLFYFLPLACLLYFLSPRPLRNTLLLLASLFFYAWGAGTFVFVLLASIAVNHVLGRVVASARAEGRFSLQRATLAAAIVANLLLLGWFKYANFAVAQIDGIASVLGAPPVEWTRVALPIGISFFTFQSISYVIDVSRGRAQVLRNPIDHALYIALFPQLIAGPIVRFAEIADQLRTREHGLDTFSSGMIRFAYGLAKKVVVADALGAVADACFAVPDSNVTTATAWLGTLAFSLQIYFDFSAYSDMAIGLGRLFGFRIPENFRRPYSAISITDFWRRWHITLSSWFRDYVYIPLGGSRDSRAHTGRNLLTIFVLTGIWHGANWTFLVWGLYHGALLLVERVTNQRATKGAAIVPLRRALTFALVTLGWVVFRVDDLGQAAHWYTQMFAFDATPLPIGVLRALTHQHMAVLALSSIVVAMPRDLVLGRVLADGSGPWPTAARAILLLTAFPYALIQVISGTYSPFLYFQF